jgi:hypothetical protein
MRPVVAVDGGGSDGQKGCGGEKTVVAGLARTEIWAGEVWIFRRWRTKATAFP